MKWTRTFITLAFLVAGLGSPGVVTAEVSDGYNRAHEWRPYTVARPDPHGNPS